ncbi:MAG: 3,4-dihydroxy-2-butanone-4-phosphate synthase, partial [Opitutales bacterium]
MGGQVLATQDKAALEAFDTIEAAVAEIAEGRPVVVTDDENRENEGDLVMAAAKATPETVNLMIRQAGGLICVPTVAHQLQRLGIQRMVAQNREAQGTDFTVSVDAAEGITTGISAYDRCRTIRLLGDPESTPDMLVSPGHIFPLQARPGGVLQRAGHTEAAVDLALLAGLPPTGVICEILNDDGSVARLSELIAFKERHGLKMVSIAQLIEYRHQRDKLIAPVGTQPFQLPMGEFQLHLFRSTLDDRLHAALTLGTLDNTPTLVRVQSQNLLTEVL